MTIRFYCGVNETRWNHHPTAPGRYTCIAPIFGSTARTQRVNSVVVPSDTLVLQDSGAFSDSWSTRLTFEAALNRQIAHAERYRYVDQITHRASYDLLIDEVWTDGNRTKRRWTVEQAVSAVEETVNAAEYLANHRNGLDLVLSAQGVDAVQYLDCVRRVVPFLDLDRDVLGLGGWCIIGKLPSVMLPVFRETVKIVIPYIAPRGVKGVHIWGVLYAPALAELLCACDKHGISVSTDSSGPQRRPSFGMWGYADWVNRNYQRPATDIRGLERARHVKAVRSWLDAFRGSTYYRAVNNRADVTYRQLSLFGA